MNLLRENVKIFKRKLEKGVGGYSKQAKKKFIDRGRKGG